MFKLIISDLDGTLLNAQHQISPRTRSVLHRLVKRGIHFIVATGRHYIDVQTIREALDLEFDLITSNGAIIHNKEGEIVYNQLLPAALSRQIIHEYRSPEVTLNVFSDTQWFVEKDMPEFLEYHKHTGFSYHVTDMKKIDKHNINKIFFIGEHGPLMNIEQRLHAQHGDALSIAFSLPTCLDIMQKGVNKGNAMKALLEQNGLSPEDAVAFGDGMNDFEMLSTVGLGVLMGNAHDRLKNKLPENPQTLTCDEDGVAEYLAGLFKHYF